mmetsp:Transcript_17242/g.38890  ORF Transcript_17242/g.38890 Transcript_17242/m.38890 type:complete len:109 (+) Transcript_17242:4347-4673(+)
MFSFSPFGDRMKFQIKCFYSSSIVCSVAISNSKSNWMIFLPCMKTDWNLFSSDAEIHEGSLLFTHSGHQNVQTLRVVRTLDESKRRNYGIQTTITVFKLYKYKYYKEL